MKPRVRPVQILPEGFDGGGLQDGRPLAFMNSPR